MPTLFPIQSNSAIYKSAKITLRLDKLEAKLKNSMQNNQTRFIVLLELMLGPAYSHELHDFQDPNPTSYSPCCLPSMIIFLLQYGAAIARVYLELRRQTVSFSFTCQYLSQCMLF